jgi:hemerythrin
MVSCPFGGHETFWTQLALYGLIRFAQPQGQRPFWKGPPQMPLIAWTSQMNVGVKLLNNDHKNLVNLINILHDGLVTGQAKPELEKAFERLVSYTRIHHANEEKFLAEAGYHGLLMHTHENDRMREQLLELQIRFIHSAQLGVDMEIMQQLRVWLFRHIQGTYQKFVSHLKTINVDAILAAWKAPVESLRKNPVIETRIEQGVW